MTRRALVTGASRGIGKAIALNLADVGYDVAVAARTLHRGEPTLEHSITSRRRNDRPLPGSLEETVGLVCERGVQGLAIRMDLTVPSSVEAGVQAILDQWGGLDLIVNNGRHIGPGIADKILDTPLEQYRLFVEAHAVAPVRIAQLVLPGMLARRSGTFVTISSIAGTKSYPCCRPGAGGSGLGYRMGKAAGHTLVGSLLSEYADHGIRGFNVDPGGVLTERNAPELADMGFDPAATAPPEAIAAVVAWLVTDPAADALMRTDVRAQKLACSRALYAW
jgi:NAD(P)-dependent dehydrogenase (short-subunit alcohol dehydrogenase family)